MCCTLLYVEHVFHFDSLPHILMYYFMYVQFRLVKMESLVSITHFMIGVLTYFLQLGASLLHHSGLTSTQQEVEISTIVRPLILIFLIEQLEK